MTHILVRPAAAALALSLAACGGAQPGTSPAPAARGESAAFLVTIGQDTVAVERYTRTATTLTGEVISRTPRVISRAYTAQLRPDGSVSRIEVHNRPLNATPSTPPTVATTEFGPEGAAVRVVRGDSVINTRVAAGPNAFPGVGGSYAFYEQAMIHARKTGAAEARLQFVGPGAPRPAQVTLTSLGGDSLRLVTGAGPAQVRVDSTGRLLALDGMESTQKFVVRRLRELDVAGLGTGFAARESAGRGLGPLSTRDSTVARVGDARVAIDYGRPFKRGRSILGEVVPFDQVWRTGANAATGLRTDRPLVIGGTPVPAGEYTLFTLPTRTGWKLIINRQTKQWGTEYHPERDLARIDMQQRTLAEPVEQFTIRVDPAAAGAATLRLQWGEVEASVPVTAGIRD
jgi:hypothetical protein